MKVSEMPSQKTKIIRQPILHQMKTFLLNKLKMNKVVQWFSKLWSKYKFSLIFKNKMNVLHQKKRNMIII